MTVVLHIGTPDRSTQAIQRFAHLRRDQLAHAGLRYPDYREIRGGAQVGHHDVAHAILGQRNERFNFGTARRWLELELSRGRADDRALLSMSGLYTDTIPPAAPDAYWRRRERAVRAAAVFFENLDVRVVFVVSRYDWYAQACFERALTANAFRRSLGNLLRHHDYLLDLARHVRLWSGHFPRVEVWTREELGADDVAAGFFAQLGISSPTGEPTRSRAALHPASLLFFEELNKADWPPERRQRAFERLISPMVQTRLDELFPFNTLVPAAWAERLCMDRRAADRQLLESHSLDAREDLFELDFDALRPLERLDSDMRAAMFELTLEPESSDGSRAGIADLSAPALRRLERRLATPVGRARRRIATAIDDERVRQLRRTLRAVRKSGSGTSERPRPPGDANEVHGGALAAALRVHDHSEARAIAEQLHEKLGLLPEHSRSRAAQLVAKTYLVMGEHVPLRELARVHHDALERTPYDPLTLAPLGDVAAGHVPPDRLVCKDGRINTFLCDRLRAHARMDLEGVCRLLLAHPDRLANNPELQLLLHNACTPGRPAPAQRALRRYLDAHGLPSLAALERRRDGLARFRFDPPRRRVSGPLVSVMMSAYDAADTIVLAIDSLLAQSWQSLEILVADDGSRDRTASLLRERYGEHPKVRLFRSTRNQGTYNVRNALMPHVRGEFVTVQDADDFALPTRIERQVEPLRRGQHSASVSNWIRVRPDGTFVFFRDLRASRLSIVSMMMRTEVLRAMGPYRTARFGADLEMYERFKARTGLDGVARIRAPLLFGLWSSRSLTRTPGAEALEDDYRSAARRLYARMAVRQAAPSTAIPDAEVEAALERSGNLVAPSGLEPLLSS